MKDTYTFVFLVFTSFTVRGVFCGICFFRTFIPIISIMNKGKIRIKKRHLDLTEASRHPTISWFSIATYSKTITNIKRKELTHEDQTQTETTKKGDTRYRYEENN